MRLLLWGGLSLLSGLLYYAAFRWLSVPFSDVSNGAFPSFAFVLAFSLLSTAAWQVEGWRRYYPAVVCLALVLAVEPFFGTADGLDAIAAVVGFVFALCILWVSKNTPPRQSTGLSLSVAVAGAAFLSGSYYVEPYDYCDYEGCASPIYMSYSELRSSVRVESAREMEDLGNLYVYGDRIFMSETGKGLHVINNSDAALPVVEGFIKLPGNTNMSIRDGFLYADSFIDLVVLDVRDSTNVFEVSRQLDVFPYDAYQAIDFDGYLTDVDHDKGVVVGYEK